MAVRIVMWHYLWGMHTGPGVTWNPNVSNWEKKTTVLLSPSPLCWFHYSFPSVIASLSHILCSLFNCPSFIARVLFCPPPSQICCHLFCRGLLCCYFGEEIVSYERTCVVDVCFASESTHSQCSELKSWDKFGIRGWNRVFSSSLNCFTVLC